MPALAKGSVYPLKDGFGIRWTEDGRRRHQSPFRNQSEAKTWFKLNVAPRLYGTEDVMELACHAIRRWVRRAPLPPAGSWVYVIAAPDLQRIKIGLTTIPGRRLSALQTAAPLQLVPLLMIPGDEAVERRLHQVTMPFAVAGASSEWRTIEALEVVLALVREQALRDPPRDIPAIIRSPTSGGDYDTGR